jgi:hypothetical protein
MTAWPADELNRMAGVDELGVSSRRPDGTLRPFITIWFARVGDDLYVRSAHGHDNPWFQRALRSGEGRIRVAGLERDVAFEVPDDGVAAAVTASYLARYGRYAPSIVGTVVSAEAVRSTLRLVPR